MKKKISKTPPRGFGEEKINLKIEQCKREKLIFLKIIGLYVRKTSFALQLLNVTLQQLLFRKTLMLNKLAAPGMEAQTKENCKTASRSGTAELVEGQKTHHC